MADESLFDLSHSAAPGGYDERYFSELFFIEDHHFWFQARNKVVATLISQITASLAPGYKVLEVGCGTGNVLRTLEKICRSGQVVGMDLFPEALEYARQRTACALTQGDITGAAIDGQFEVIGAFDVLEHLQDDLRALRNLNTMLRPQGALLMTVPAHPSLWSYFDEASHHCRRYRLADLKGKLAGAGFEIEYMTFYMSILFPMMWLKRRLTSLTRNRNGHLDQARELAAAEFRILPGFNEAMVRLLGQEVRLIAKRRSLPFGTSLLAIARKGQPG